MPSFATAVLRAFYNQDLERPRTRTEGLAAELELEVARRSSLKKTVH